ncbi:MAG: universal stress protein [Haloarculaceae archaeon]
MEIETVLVPVDGSDEASAAVEYAVAVSDRYGADLHALHVFGEDVAARVDAGELTSEEVIADSESFVATVREAARDTGVAVSHSTAYGFSPRSLSVHPGSVILDAAEDAGADFLVVPREPVTGDPEAVLEKAAEYVIAHASQPVLSV